MNTQDLDIVHFIKEGYDNEELRYSLRSIDQNLPHKSVWIYGWPPCGIQPDRVARFAQTGRTKWDRVRSMYEKLVLNDDLSENFILFNDDFFVMKPITKLPHFYAGTLEERYKVIEDHFGGINSYTIRLRRTESRLKELGLTTKNYELHIPMIINKKKFQEQLERYANEHGASRSFYGNTYKIGGTKTKDVKVYDLDGKFNHNTTFLSTTDESFESGKVGEFIRSKFPHKSRFER